MASRTFKRALVTGASSGIGQAMARQLADRGAHLVLVARSLDRLGTLASELRERAPVEVEVLRADLTDEDDVTAVARRLRRTDAPVDLLINNAGFGQVGRFVELDVDRAERQVRLNALTPVRLAHAFVPRVRATGGGLLNVASIAAFQPVPTMATYAATKAMLSSWSQALHEELRGTGIHVTVLAPGFTRTEFATAIDADREASRVPGVVWADPERVARVGLEGVVANRAVVVPGGLYRAGAGISAVTPSAVMRRVVGLGARFGRH